MAGNHDLAVKRNLWEPLTYAKIIYNR